MLGERRTPCSRLNCAANLPGARSRRRARQGDIADALNGARRDCNAQQPEDTPPSVRSTIRPSFDCGRATHKAEYAICARTPISPNSISRWRPPTTPG